MTRLALVALLLEDYDEGLRFFSSVGFTVTEDMPLQGGKRWVVVRPTGGEGSGLLLARATTPAQRERIGAQTGGRVGFFLDTDDLPAELARWTAAGAAATEAIRHEDYGDVCVVTDPWGNQWDLVQRRRAVEPVRVVAPAGLCDADPTPGMQRQQAFQAPGLWAGLVHTDPGATSGWHHHGEHETSLYVVSGEMRLDFGPGGEESGVAGAGSFVHVPAWTVHRESNPGSDIAVAVIARSGWGAPTVNVEAPA